MHNWPSLVWKAFGNGCWQYFECWLYCIFTTLLMVSHLPNYLCFIHCFLHHTVLSNCLSAIPSFGNGVTFKCPLPAHQTTTNYCNMYITVYYLIPIIWWLICFLEPLFQLQGFSSSVVYHCGLYILLQLSFSLWYVSIVLCFWCFFFLGLLHL